MITYARGLQYWAEKHNLPESPDPCPLAGGVVELREAVREYVTFTNCDVFQDLGVVYPGATNQQPQTTLFSQVLLPPGNESSELYTGFTEATTQTAAQLLLTQLDVPPHHLEWKGKTITCWLSLPL